LAEQVDVPYETILRYIREHRITVYKFSGGRNGRIRIKPEDARRFVEAARQEAAA